MFERMFHPWRTLRALGHIDLSWEVLPGLLGRTNGVDEIHMHPEQLQVERRSTLAHELAHVELGHTQGCAGADERAARELAARWLVTIECLVEAGRWARSIEELADELWVDVETTTTRLTMLTDDERERYEAARRDVEAAR